MICLVGSGEAMLTIHSHPFHYHSSSLIMDATVEEGFIYRELCWNIKEQ